MAVVTAQEVVKYTDINATEAQVEASGLIPVVQQRIIDMTNNEFVTDLYMQGGMTFNATDRTIINTAGVNWTANGFAAGDEIRVYSSYRNDGGYTVLSISTSALTLVTGSSVVDELSGRSILVSVVKWPTPVKYVAAQMVQYDHDERGKRRGVASESLGPHSISYVESGDYPDDVVNGLAPFTITRMM